MMLAQVQKDINLLTDDAPDVQWERLAVRTKDAGGPDFVGQRHVAVVAGLRAWVKAVEGARQPKHNESVYQKEPITEHVDITIDVGKRERFYDKVLNNTNPAEWKNLYHKGLHAFPGEMDIRGKDDRRYKTYLMAWAGDQSFDATEQPDMVDHPPHYTQGSIEPIDVIEDWGLGYHVGQVFKYLCRAPHKGSELEDLKKARWYLDRYISKREGS